MCDRTPEDLMCFKRKRIKHVLFIYLSLLFFILAIDTILLPDLGLCSVQENADSQKGFLGMCLTLAHLKFLWAFKIQSVFKYLPAWDI